MQSLLINLLLLEKETIELGREAEQSAIEEMNY